MVWSDHYQKQVNRNMGLLTEKDQEILRKACVAVCGLGGLGGVVVENLARLGVESFVLVDHGTFEPTNSNRQIYSFTDTNGRLKTEVTEEFLRRINPAIRTRKYLTMTDQNIGEVLEGVDAVALSIDDIRAIVTLSRAARAKKIPLIEGWAVAYGNVRVFTADTPTLEEVYALPTIGRAVASISDQESRELILHSLRQLQGVEGLAEYYPPPTVERLMQKGEGTTLAPMVWLTCVLMANEIFKVLTGWGSLALAPNFRFYDPMEGRIPGAVKK
ncbi:MAG: ThiF family adenylyltransferase [Elusimicrobia bacterium]|nr:ThiF family adenylyltransferase [Elusimicrobiota bacterium]